MSFSLNSDFDLQEALTVYLPKEKREQDFKIRMLSLLNEFQEKAFDRALLHAHFTASAWIIDEASEQALLMHHRKLDKWLQLGGHADGDSNLIRVVVKEIKEESGLKHFELAEPTIFDIDIHTIPKRKEVAQHEHFDVRFLFLASHMENLKPNYESKDMRWIEWEKVDELCKNESIQRMNRKAQKLQVNSNL